MSTQLQRPPMARPQTAKAPNAPVQTPAQANAARVSKAHRVYVLAKYEWLRLRAVGLGYLTPSGYTPLPLKGDETLADIQARVKTLSDWLKVNDSADPAPRAQAPKAAPEPKRFAIPEKAPQVPCRSCGEKIVFASTGAGKVAPLNLDGTSHFATCPNADAHRNGPTKKPTAAARSVNTSDVPDHVRKLHDIAVGMGLSHGREHRIARLAKTNVFLMNNEREPVETWRGIREEDFDLLAAGLRKRALRWP